MPLPQVLVIDDDPDLCELIQDSLFESYTITLCNNANTEAVDLVQELQPAVIVLDINLPNGNGLDLCKTISLETKSPPLILLISGDNSLEVRLDAYNSGGADFLAKPFRLQELRAKVDTLNKLHQRQRQLTQSSDYATKTAMNAMAEASQYGEVLRFYNAMYKTNSVKTVASNFFRLMENFGLQSSIQFRTRSTESYDHLNQECSPIELQIYESLAESDRLISFSNRLMVNGTYASFIIKNMPTDEVSHGRLRDILATLIEGVDGKLVELQRLDLLRQTSAELAASTQRLSKVINAHEGFITDAMNHVISEISGSFNTLEMTEAQEVFFTKLSEKLINSMEESFIHVGNETDVLDCLRLSLSVMLSNGN